MLCYGMDILENVLVFFHFDIFNNHDTGFKDTSFLANLLTYLHEKEQFNYALGARTKLCVAPRHVTTYYRSNTIKPVLSVRRELFCCGFLLSQMCS